MEFIRRLVKIMKVCMPCCCRSQKITVEDIEVNLEKIEEIVKENIQENIEGNIEENIQENIQENIEENVEENIQENIEENIQENVEENIQEKIEENIHQKNEELLKVVIRDFIDELYHKIKTIRSEGRKKKKHSLTKKLKISN